MLILKITLKVIAKFKKKMYKDEANFNEKVQIWSYFKKAMFMESIIKYPYVT